MWSPLAECLKWMSSYNILSYVMSPSTGSLENEYSFVWKCSPSLWFIMDEGALYGCHNSALSTASSQTAPLRGSSQFIIDHPSSPHLLRSAQDERMTMRKRNIKIMRATHFLCLSLKFGGYSSSAIDLSHADSLQGLKHLLSCYLSWSRLLPFSLFFSPFISAFLSLKGTSA